MFRPRKLPRALAWGLAAAALALVAAELTLRSIRTDAYRVWPPGLEALFRPAPGLLPGVAGEARFVVGPEGFRADPLPAQAHTLLALGGSTTECLYLDHEEAWPWLLQERLRSATGQSVWVPNAGRSGRNLRDHVVQLIHLLPQEPSLDAVLLMTGVNDLQLRLAQDEAFEPIDLRQPQAVAELLPRAFERVPLARNTGPIWRRTALWHALSDLKWRWFGSPGDEAVFAGLYRTWREHRAAAAGWRTEPPDLESALDEYERHLLHVVALCERAGVRLVLLTQPFVWADDLPPEVAELLWLGGIGDFQKEDGCVYYTAGALARALDAFNTRLRGVAATAEIECFDLATALGQDPHWYYDDVHFNEAGARRVAELVCDYLVARPPFMR